MCRADRITIAETLLALPGSHIFQFLNDAFGIPTSVDSRALQLFSSTLSATVTHILVENPGRTQCRVAELNDMLEMIGTLTNTPEGLRELERYYRLVFQDFQKPTAHSSRPTVRCDLC